MQVVISLCVGQGRKRSKLSSKRETAFQIPPPARRFGFEKAIPERQVQVGAEKV